MRKSSFFRLSSFVALWLAMAALARAYPAGAPGTWLDWQTKIIDTVRPVCLSAATDPDGRLRLAFIDSAETLTVFGPRHPVKWASYTRFVSGSPRDRFLSGRASTYADSEIKHPSTSDLASSRPMSRARVALSIGQETARFRPCYGWIATDLSSYESFWGTVAGPLPLFPRNEFVPLIATSGGALHDHQRAVGVAANRTLTARVGAVSLEVAGQARLAVRVSFVLALPPAVGTETPVTEVALPGSGWADDRSCDGVHAAFNEPVNVSGSTGSEECDLYVLVATQKRGDTQTERELRLFRQHVVYPTANPAALLVTTVENRVIASSTKAGSEFPGSGGYPYGKVLVTSQRSPSWVVWQDGAVVRAAKRLDLFVGLPNELPLTYGVADPFTGAFATGIEPDAALDRLDRLHLVWRQQGTPDFCLYARENASAGFEWTAIGVCSGAPAVAVGPGEYPWIAYPGDADAGSPLVIRYPRGLYDSYHGDFEDFDGDGRCGLLEKVTNTSDTTANFPLEPLAVSLTGTGTSRHAVLSYVVDPAAVRDGTTTRFTLPDGNDTLEIVPTWTVGLQTWSSTGLTLEAAFNVAGRGKVVSVNDSGTLLSFPAQSYRLQVRRLLGAP